MRILDQAAFDAWLSEHSHFQDATIPFLQRIVECAAVDVELAAPSRLAAPPAAR